MSAELVNSQQEQQLFELLDTYVRSLQGQGDDAVDPPAELLNAVPELADLLDCLDSLHAFSPPLTNGMPVAVPGDPVECEFPWAPNGAEEPSSLNEPFNSPAAFPRGFGRYELLNELGRGGMGVVYRARHTELNSVVALKLVRSSQLASAEEIRRFREEARAAATLRHPNIVSVHDVGECFGQHYLVMDFIGGGNLSDRVAQGPVPPHEAARILRTVAVAVHYLHGEKIVHRDLKPSNILIDSSGAPCVTDFGLAKSSEGDSGHTCSGAIIGTPAYMAPEQAAGQSSRVTPRSDVYSLGAILYSLLTGRPPFQEANPLDTLLQVLEAVPEAPRKLNPQIPPDLEAICLRCLEKNPLDRFATAEELAKELDRFLKDEPVQLPARTLKDRLQRWVYREPALASRLGVLAFAMVIVHAYFHLGGHSDLIQHLQVIGLLALWTALSIVFQTLLGLPVWERKVPYLWALADTVCYTLILMLADGPLGPVLIGYPVLIAGAGLWAEVRLVWFMTALTVAAYAVLSLDRAEPGTPWHYPLIFAASLVGLGAIVAYQVQRLRSLAKYFERHR